MAPQGVDLQFLKPPRPDARIDARLRALRDCLERLEDLPARNEETTKLVRRQARQSFGLARPGSSGFRIGEKARASQVEDFTATNEIRAVSVRGRVVADEIRARERVTV